MQWFVYTTRDEPVDIKLAHDKFTKTATKYNLVSLNLDTKNLIKDGAASFIGFGSVSLQASLASRTWTGDR